MAAFDGFVDQVFAPGSPGQVTYNLPAGSGRVKALLLFWTEQAAGGSSDTWRLSTGAATQRNGVVSQWCVTSSNVDAQAATAGSIECATDALGILLDQGSTTRDGEVDLISMGVDQFVLDWVNIPTTASTFATVVAFCGVYITDALAALHTAASGTGALDVTVASGFGQPDVVMTGFPGTCLAAATDAWVASSVLIGHGFGAGIKDGNQYMSLISDDVGSAAMDIGTWGQDGRIAGWVDDADPTVVNCHLTLAASSGWPADGFEVTRSTTMQQSFGYLALKGSFNKALSELATNTTPGPPQTSDFAVGFSNQKVAICFGGNHGLTADTAPRAADTDGYEWWIGACDHLGNQGYVGASNEDSAIDSDTYSNATTGRTLRMTNADDGTTLTEADGSFTGSNFRLTYQTINATARGFGAVVFGWDVDPIMPLVNYAREFA